jgi:hypothetical protein
MNVTNLDITKNNYKYGRLLGLSYASNLLPYYGYYKGKFILVRTYNMELMKFPSIFGSYISNHALCIHFFIES